MALVVDTNVWVVAAGRAAVGAACETTCISALSDLAERGTLAVDMDHQILGEYHSNVPPGTLPDVLLRGMLRVAGRVEYRQCRWERAGVAVVPDCLRDLDPSDRKFAAVALTYMPPAPILNATDTDWQQCAAGVREAGLAVRELCPDELRSGSGGC